MAATKVTANTFFVISLILYQYLLGYSKDTNKNRNTDVLKTRIFEIKTVSLSGLEFQLEAILCHIDTQQDEYGAKQCYNSDMFIDNNCRCE
ncbi:hypothetical protein KL86DYS1_20113 [uncultured Dysgonomonas sp.]|uniref:Uncharacterized protein n=1 Tax=uncultured Dysgonomonas sp. TaxID=206096 RepID=A0A212JL25_9BACT|nr:hypothetical protein KL86DYS1_20113 [uncultured Dysgonomonas sp.]